MCESVQVKWDKVAKALILNTHTSKSCQAKIACGDLNRCLNDSGKIMFNVL